MSEKRKASSFTATSIFEISFETLNVVHQEMSDPCRVDEIVSWDERRLQRQGRQKTSSPV